LSILKKPSESGFNDTVLFTGREMNDKTKCKLLTDTLYKISIKHDIPRILIKDLRHTCAVYAFNKTGNINAVANLLGHKRLETTYNYYAKSIVESINYDKIN